MKKILALIVALCCLTALFVPALAAEDTITVYVDAPPDWSEVYLYVWFNNGTPGGDTPTMDWPGKKMNDDGNGWFSLEIPAGSNRLIANNGNGTQTIDLSMDGSIDCWLTVNDNGADGKLGGDVTFDNPGDALDEMPTVPTTEAAPEELKSLALVGEGLPNIETWVVEDANGDMKKESDTVYTKEIAVTNGTAMKFKVAGNDTWETSYNFGGSEDPTAVTIGTALDLVSGNESKNLSLTATKDCTLKFTVTLKDDGTASLLVEEVEAPAPTEPTETEPTETEPTETEPAETEDTKPQETEPQKTDDKSGARTTAIIVLALVLVLLIGVAVIISIVPGKNDV